MATLSTLQSRVLSNLSLVTGNIPASGGSFSLADVTRHINQAYQYDIPEDTGGHEHKEEWAFTTVQGTAVYTWTSTFGNGDRIIGLDAYVLRDDTPIDVDTEYKVYWSTQNRESTTQGQPDRALIWARELTLRPVPDAAYDMKLPGLFYRTALSLSGGAQAGTTSDAREDYAVELRAAQLAARQLNKPQRATELGGMYQDELQKLLGRVGKQRRKPVVSGFDF